MKFTDAVKTIRDKFETFTITNHIRFACRDGKKILQQGYQGQKGSFWWIDVPCVDDENGDDTT